MLVPCAYMARSYGLPLVYFCDRLSKTLQLTPRGNYKVAQDLGAKIVPVDNFEHAYFIKKQTLHKSYKK
jgi:1-aminocyclopropane-1-carboxylate deaminase/D-cysteine desulfhydrase-like pyridoxal-dependent ACC family enzyme